MAESRAKRLWTTVANWPKAKRARTSSAFHVETPLGHIGQLAQRGEFVGKNLRFWRFGPGCGPTGSAVVSPLLRGEKAFTERNLLPRLDLCNVFSRRLRHPYRSGNPKIQEPNSKGQIRIAGAETKERKSGISRTKFQGPSPNCPSPNKGVLTFDCTTNWSFLPLCQLENTVGKVLFWLKTLTGKVLRQAGEYFATRTQSRD